MEVKPTCLDGVVELVPKRHGDSRGWFCETWNSRTLQAAIGLEVSWVQDNESFSALAHTLRGIHYQVAPYAQDKLVRAVNGSVLDVAVDLRSSSPTFGRHVAVILTADAGNQLFVPKGFGHAFMTLEPNCLFSYKVSGPYHQPSDQSLAWDDPSLGIDWGTIEPHLSEKDKRAPQLESAELFE